MDISQVDKDSTYKNLLNLKRKHNKENLLFKSIQSSCIYLDYFVSCADYRLTGFDIK